MNKFLAKTLQGDRVVWIIFALLFAISVVEMFSASSMLVHWSSSSSVYNPILRHVMFFAVGFMALMVVQTINFKYIRLLGYAGLSAVRKVSSASLQLCTLMDLSLPFLLI